jgi:hypothetical protein
MVSYIYGGNTGIKNPEELARARAMAEALLGPQRPAQNVGEGLAVLGQAIRGRREMNAANRASEAGSASAQSAIAQALGGGGAFPAAPSLAPSGSQVSAASVPQTASAQAIRDGLIKRGLPEHVADGFLMNFQDESGLNPGINEQNPTVPGSRGGYGLYQLTGPRRRAYEQFASQRGVDPADTDAQLDFMMSELQGPENAAYKSIMAAPDSGHAAAAIVDNFLRPAESHRAARAASYLKSGAPVQVASNDPSAGIAQALGGQQAPSPVAAALQLPQQAPAPQARPDITAALSGPPQPGVTPGAPAAATPAGPRVVQQMVNPQSMTGGAPLPMMGQPPQAQAVPAPPPPQVAQAQPNLDQIPVEAGGNAGAVKQGQLPSVQQLMEAAQNPWLNDGQRTLLNGLLEQQMKQSDPATQLGLEKARLDMEKTRIETERLRNPQMSPAEQARLDLDRQKFEADQKKLMELSAGTTVFDPNTRQPVYKAPEKAAELPAGVQEYEYAKKQGFPGTFADWEASKKGGMSLQVDPTTGEVTFQQGSNIKPMTEAQSKDTTFATRAEGALPLVDKFGDALTNLGQSAGGQVPVIGNYMKSPEYQQAEQAGKEFLQAILRKDTGAAITAGETAEYGSVYLPRPGDSPELLAQKKASRARALEALKAGMTPQALLAQEKAIAASGQQPAPEAPKKRLKFNPATGELE